MPLLACLQKSTPEDGRGNDAGRPAFTGLLMIDVDVFKLVNDHHGHAAGDAVLAAIVDRLRAIQRKEDVVTLWGGEEFLLLLSDTAPDQLVATSGRVLPALGREPVE